MAQSGLIDRGRAAEIAAVLSFLCLFIPALVWGALSAVVSFAALEWVSITAQPMGRLAFLLILIWEWRVGIKTVREVMADRRA